MEAERAILQSECARSEGFLEAMGCALNPRNFLSLDAKIPRCRQQASLEHQNFFNQLQNPN